MVILPLMIILGFMLILTPKFVMAAVVIALAAGIVIKFTAAFMGLDATIMQSIKAAFLSVFFNLLANQFATKLIPNSDISMAIVFIASGLAFSYLLKASYGQAIVISIAFWSVFLAVGFYQFGLTLTSGYA